MPTPFVTITAERTIKASQQEYEELQAALDEENEGDCPSGFEIHYNDGEIFVLAPDGDWDRLTDLFLCRLGALIAKNGLNFLEFGAAFTSSRDVPGSAGGMYFRIRKDGSLWEPRFKWRCSRRVKVAIQNETAQRRVLKCPN
jgi:hypothetical protein